VPGNTALGVDGCAAGSVRTVDAAIAPILGSPKQKVREAKRDIR